MSIKEAYENKLQAQLDLWRAEADKLQAKARGAGADTQIKMNEEAEALRARIDKAQTKLNGLKDSGTEALDDLKGGFEQSWADLGDAVKSAVNRFG